MKKNNKRKKNVQKKERVGGERINEKLLDFFFRIRLRRLLKVKNNKQEHQITIHP